jgi:RimJ/RimL family protein N-acetyltransferase
MALVRSGFMIERLGSLEIHCSEKNIPSMAIPAKLGFRRQLPLPSVRPEDDDTVIWVLKRNDFSAMPYRYFKMRAYDENGTLLDMDE